jgi:hypothetical protein
MPLTGLQWLVNLVLTQDQPVQMILEQAQDLILVGISDFA